MKWFNFIHLQLLAGFSLLLRAVGTYQEAGFFPTKTGKLNESGAAF